MAQFAIYSDDDLSLDFYNRTSTPSAGSIFEGKTATKVYTSISASNPAWKTDGNVKKIVSSTVVDTVSPTRTSNWFNGAEKLELVDLSKLNTTNVTDMNYMFGGCLSLEYIDVSNFNTSKVTNLRCMFYNCSNLQEIDVSNFDTGAVTNFEYVFYACIQANIIGVENWNTSNGTSMMSMFYKCASTPHLDLSGWNTSKVTNMSWMFNRGAGTVDFTGWDTSNVTTFKGMFSNAYYTYLDLSSFDVSASENFNSMFFNSTSLKTILVSYNWNERLPANNDSAWMFENCYQLMGDIAYSDLNDVAEPEDYTHMTSLYATTKNGYLTLKYVDDEDEEDISPNSQSYLVMGSTLTEIANSLRKILGTPQRIPLKNFNRILNTQVNSVDSARLVFKDKVHDWTDDVGNVGNIYYISSSMALQYSGLNRFYIMPTIMKGSVCSLINLKNLSDESEIVCSGDIEQLDNHSFLINGDCTIEIVPKNSSFAMMNLRKPSRIFSHGAQNDYDQEV